VTLTALVRLACAALCLLLAQPCIAQRPADFEARLELSRNGKLFGEMTFQLSSDGDRWTMVSATRGTRGLARFLGLDENSRSEGLWLDDRPQPLRYERHVDVIKNLDWSADFDWQQGKVYSVYPDGESTLDLEPGILDEAALGLVIRAGLERGEDDWTAPLLDEEKIEQAHFRVRDVEDVQTALGCMRVHVVEKVRGEGNKRYTRTYYAENQQFVPVLMQHGKRGGDHIEGRVVELSIAGKAVPAGPDCPTGPS